MKNNRTIIRRDGSIWILNVDTDLSCWENDERTPEERRAFLEKVSRNASFRIQLKDYTTEPYSEADVFTAPGDESS